MGTENSEKKIYSAICSVMSEIGAIGKNKKNQQQGFAYRGIDDVMNALQPLLSKHKVFVTPEIMEQRREERQTAKGGNLIYSICTVKYTFYTTDGSSVSAIVIGEGMDSGDKATNKAMSIAFKYACFQVFCIPTDEMKDPDAETPDESKPVKKTLTQNQIKRLYAIAHKANIDNDTVVEQVKKKFGCMPCELTKQQYDAVCAGYEKIGSQNG
ncbi:MAG: ERF family protein [Zhenhengia sp.]|uniref:ERF family protein n=1 Tax=Zhenhengia sp. TaxID=2944208 RepID=UPI0039953D00